ncbi:MAG: MFS transporter [Nocardioidaceae bacterium]|nr:MFS transporter [Nocardioidaceae bacterium]
MTGRRPAWSAWRTVTWFGFVSLAGDLVYEGARSITGPYLASLGASALLVGLVTGAGEAAAMGLRLVFGPLADRSQRYWSLTVAGYAMTAVSVPLMAVAPFVGSAGLVVAATLVVTERTGKAVRSPSKSALLAHAAASVGRGRGFAVHKALDQVGAFVGPLLVAAVIALSGRPWLALAVLAVPGAVALLLLARIHRAVPDLSVYDPPETPVAGTTGVVLDRPGRLPARFYLFAGFAAATTVGLMTFGVISFHLVHEGLVPAAIVPVVYAVGMAVEAVAALATGFAYDRLGARVLVVLPVGVALVPLLTFAPTLAVVLLGIVLWGAATGVLDSTVKAEVAALVPAARLATAYGVFAAFQAGAALLGGVLAGWLYGGGRADLVAVIAACQVGALVLLVVVLRRDARFD